MLFQKQISHHDPDNGHIGDCFRTCLACLLDKRPEEVPHFTQLHYTADGIESPELRDHLKSWLFDNHFMGIVDVPYVMDGMPADLMQHLAKKDGEDMCYMLSGMSPRGFPHVVICRGDKILWDPSPSETGIVAPINGIYLVSYLVSGYMRYNL